MGYVIQGELPASYTPLTSDRPERMPTAHPASNVPKLRVLLQEFRSVHRSKQVFQGRFLRVPASGCSGNGWGSKVRINSLLAASQS